MKKILVVEDDEDIRELLHYNLKQEGFQVRLAENGPDGLSAALRESVDLVVLDLMLPGMSGIEVCKRIRSDPGVKNLPVIMLTAKGEETDVVFGLGVGADDYMIKPFSVKELIARIYTRLRTSASEDPSGEVPTLIKRGGVEIDRARFQVKVEGASVPMTLAEFRLFESLATHPGIVLSRERLLDCLSGGEAVLIDRNVDVHITAIRKKLGTARHLIETVRGVGYRFREE